MTEETRQLAGGLVLRTATPADIDGILALQGEAFGLTEVPIIRTCLEPPFGAIDDWSVVVDGDEVVSTCALFSLPLVLDGTPLPAGQIEFVATAPPFQGRGLVRAQFERHHVRSAAQGHLLQLVGGIPYFYRQFGYGYGISYADLYTFERSHLHPPPDVSLRPALDADAAAIMALEPHRATDGLRYVRSEQRVRHWIAATRLDDVGRPVGTERFFVAERGGEVVGWAAHSIEGDTRRLLLLPAVTTDEGVADAIIAHALDEAGDELVVLGHDTPGTAYGDRLRAVGRPYPYGLGLYVRIEDPVGFLRHLRPVLSRRLAASAFAHTSGRVELSLYRSGIAIEHAAGEVTAVEAIPGVLDPMDVDECGVAPDWFPALALGRFGAKALDARTDDVSLGRHADLLEVLFPKVDTDLVGDF